MSASRLPLVKDLDEPVGEQCTVGGEAVLTGVGLHTGLESRVRLSPAGPGTGIRFRRGDLPGRPEIPAEVVYAEMGWRETVLARGEVRVRGVEHCLAAASGLGVDNLVVEVDGEELPALDGSALPYVTVLTQAGITVQSLPRDPLIISTPDTIRDGQAEFLVVPSSELVLGCLIEFDHPAIGCQFACFPVDPETFGREIAPARTFGFLTEVEELRRAGLIKGGSLENAVVFTGHGVVNEEPLRFPDEPVRHKLLDLLGDLALLGRPLVGRILALRSGHQAHLRLVRHLACLVRAKVKEGESRP